VNKLIPAVPDVLWHYTCIDHGHPGIYGSGEVRPNQSGIAWFTDLERPWPDALGLTRVSLRCNRSGIRYRIDDTSDVISWLSFRRQEDLSIPLIQELEAFPGALPRHWFVSVVPVGAVYDPL